MKERYNIEIAGIQLAIVSEEPEEFVNAIVARIDERVNDLVIRNKRCSKLDAALLCALDYCGDSVKAEKRIRNLEAQISLYDANIKRMREEIANSQNASQDLKKALGVAEEKPEASAAEAEEKVEAAQAPEEKKPAPPAASKKSKIEQIEMLLRNTND